MPRRLRVVTLGCSKNTVDTEHLLAQLPPDAFCIVDGDEPDMKEQDELWAYREAIRRDPERRILFSLAKDASIDEVLHALVNGCTAHATNFCHLLERNACLAGNHLENLFV